MREWYPKEPIANSDVFAFRGDPLKFVELLPWLCVTVFAVGGLIAALYFLRFLKNWQSEEPDDEQSLLVRFRDLHRKGKLSADEFREVRISLAEQMKRRAEESQDGDEER